MKNPGLNNALVLFLIAGLFYNGCKCNNKEDTPKPIYKISGRVYKDCSKAPLANYPIKIYQKYEIGVGYKIEEAQATGTTDSLGHFSVDFEPNTSNQDIVLKCNALNSTSTILSGIPKGKNIEDIVAYKSATACVKVSLDVINPHGAGEVFTITDLRTFSPLNINCPLTNGFSYIANNFPASERYYDFYDSQYIVWYFNGNTQNSERLNFKIDKFCSDTIFITATVR